MQCTSGRKWTKLKHSEEKREVLKKELGYNKHECLDNYFNLARATEEKLQQMSNKVEATEVANPGKPSRSQKNLRMTQTDASILG